MSRQSSLFSFFSPKDGRTAASPSSTPQLSTTPSRRPQSGVKTTDRTPLRSVNLTRKVDLETEDAEEDMPPSNSQSSRKKRVIISSDEEDGVEKKDGARTTVKRPRVAKEKLSFHPEAADAFIKTFQAEDNDLQAISTKVSRYIDGGLHEKSEDFEDEGITKKKKTADDDEIEQYQHETLDFLKLEKIRDANRRRPSDPDYDPSALYVPPDFLKEQSPGHQQWWQLKAANFDTVLLFKVGKFYELYHMDATVAVTCLNLAYMKGRFAHSGFPESAYGRFADQLVTRGFKVARVEQTETPQQLEVRNKKIVGTKDKVVRRELCRVTSIATRTFDAMETAGQAEGGEGAASSEPAEGNGDSLSASSSSPAFLLAIKEERDSISGSSSYGVCFIDTSIGRFHIGQFDDDAFRCHLRTLIARHPPAQVLVEKNILSSSTRSLLSSMLAVSVPIESLAAKKQFYSAEKAIALLLEECRLGGEVSAWPSALRGLLLESSPIPQSNASSHLAWSALGAVIFYLARCQIDIDMLTMRDFESFHPLASKKMDSESEKGEGQWRGRRMVLDGVVLEQLSLVPLEYSEESSSSSLFAILNKCRTPFGARLLRSWVCAPSCDPSSLRMRQKVVSWLRAARGSEFIQKVQSLLDQLPDLERILQRIHTVGLSHRSSTHPDSRAVLFEADKYAKRRIRDLLSALDAFRTCESIGCVMESSELPHSDDLNESDSLLSSSAFALRQHLTYFEEAFDASSAEKEGRIMPRPGADSLFDSAVEAVSSRESALHSFRSSVSSSLRCSVSFYGSGKSRFQLEIPDTVKVPREYEAKSKRKGFTRYSTPELDNLISKLESAEAEADVIVKDATRKMFSAFDERKKAWKRCVDALATLDVLCSLAVYSDSTGVKMTIPEMVYDLDEPVIEIECGYHPCIVVTGLPRTEELAGVTASSFIPNDIQIGGRDGRRCILLTGPNMGGKSTLMRQVALLTILAHMGSLVPARRMRLSPVDRIFTRIGSCDRLVAGESTFFVEMNESKVALRDATKHSLIIVDELGRGTGSMDGQALAWAIMDEVCEEVAARSLFSTHYHSLCERVKSHSSIRLQHMACMVETEEGDKNEEQAIPSAEAVTFLFKLVDGICPRSFGFHAAKLAGISDEVISESWRAARQVFGDASRWKAVEVAARDSSVSIDQLRVLLNAVI